jgi:hypothetical protein
MKQMVPMVVLAMCACGPNGEENQPAPNSAALNAVLPPSGPASRQEAVVPRPADQSQIDRMILAGYTPHGDHLHPPGVKECPMAQGSNAVM